MRGMTRAQSELRPMDRTTRTLTGGPEPDDQIDACRAWNSMDENAASESDRPEDLYGAAPVKRIQAAALDPVVQKDDEDVVAGCCDPAESGLPAELAGHRVELHSIDHRNERIECVLTSPCHSRVVKLPSRNWIWL